MKTATTLSFALSALLLSSGFLAGYFIPALQDALLGSGTLALFFLTMPLFLIQRYRPKLKQLDDRKDPE